MSNPYITYWDNIIREWADNGHIPASEECWFTPDSTLRQELMPEPYWGDPDNCSAVLLNYNPGGPDGEPSPTDNCHRNHVLSEDMTKMSGAMHSCYSRIALEFPWLDESCRDDFTSNSSHLPTKKWMRQRNRWISCIAGSCRKPFFIDLCGWHSKNWRLRKYTPEIDAYVAQHLRPVLGEAVKKSDLGIGLCVGKQIGDDVLSKLGYKDVTAELGFDVKALEKGWQPDGEVNRWYRIYRSADGLYFINTWAIGSNRQPGARFNKYEQKIITKIKNIE